MIFEKHIVNIKKVILDYFSELKIDNNLIQIQETKKEFSGDWTVILFPLKKFSNLTFSEFANELGDYLLTKEKTIKSYNIVSGFLNLEFTDKFWLEILEFSFSPNFELNKKKNSTIVLESCSPNTNKPLHLGHLRNILLGHAMSNILIANGFKVHKVQIINDRGIHICKSMLAWLKFGKGDTPSKSNMKGDYFVGKYYVLFEQKYQEERNKLLKSGYSVKDLDDNSKLLHEVKTMLRKWESGDKELIELWMKMNSWVYDGFEDTYKKIGISFDKIYYESDTYLIGKDFIKKGLEKNIFNQKDDKSVWVNLEDKNLDNKLLLRSDGTAVYITQDIGTAICRYNDFSFDKMIYVVGNEQNHHFKVLFEILNKMNYSWSKELFHMSYGMVTLPEGKMKSREGTVVDIDDLLDEMHKQAKEIILSSNKIDIDNIDNLSVMIGDAALKYYILKPDAKKDILFNPAESIDFNGHTGPFIQYTYARINSILEKSLNLSLLFKIQRSLLFEEKKLIKLILNYPIIISQSSEKLNPAVLANYLFNLAKEYNHFYQKIPILNVDNFNDINFRVTLSKKVSVLLSKGMNLLGIKVPSKM